MNAPILPVVIIGAGPTGLTAATLLAQYGVECLVLDRWESVYPQPRAVHLDDEIYRILARLGLARASSPRSPGPATGCACSTATCGCWPSSAAAPPPAGTATPRPTCSTSPSWRASCCAPTWTGTPRSPLRGNTEVTALTQDEPRPGPGRLHRPDHRRAGLGTRRSTSWAATAPTASPAPRSAPPCRTSVRAALARRRRGHRPPTSAEWEGVHQVCDPNAPATYMRIGTTRYRWEFRLAPGETAEDYRDIARLHPLISPWTGDIPVDEAAASSAWPSTPSAPRSPTAGATAGSSCSATPPTSPHRSSARAWAPACATRPTSPGNSPASSTAPCPKACWTPTRLERKPHARALIRLAKLVGAAMTEGGELGNLAPQPGRAPAAPHPRRQAARPRQPDPTAAPQRPRASTTACAAHWPDSCAPTPRSTTAAGSTTSPPAGSPSSPRPRRPPSTTPRSTRRGAALVVAAPGTELHRWLRRGGAHAAIVRPDGTVLRAGRDLTSVCVYLPAFHPIRRTPTEELSGNRVTEASRGLLASGGEAAVEGHLKELRAGFQRIIQRRWPARVVEARDRQGDASEGGLLVGEVAASHDHAHQLEYGRSGSIMVRK